MAPVALMISRGFALSAAPAASTALPQAGLKGFAAFLSRQPLGVAAGGAAAASSIAWGLAASPVLGAHADAAYASGRMPALGARVRVTSTWEEVRAQPFAVWEAV